MEMHRSELLEQQMTRLFKMSIAIHSVGGLILAYLLCFEPTNYENIGAILSILAFAACIFLSSRYMEAENELKKIPYTQSKGIFRKFSERLSLFYFSYAFWGCCLKICCS